MNYPACPLPPGSDVYAYLRDSGGDDQDLASQRDYVIGYCKRHRLNLFRVFEDSALKGSSTVGRDEFEEMIDLARSSDKPLVAGILYWDIKRFARNKDDSQFFKADLRRRGYRLISLSDNIPEGDAGGLI
jgi:DNA invertase Pin-like site-specific DNA recombinase